MDAPTRRPDLTSHSKSSDMRYVGALLRELESYTMTLRHPRAHPEFATTLGLSLETLLRTEMREIRNLHKSSGMLPDALQEHAISMAPRPPRTNVEQHLIRRAFQWQRAIIEMLDRLRADWQDLVGSFELDADVALKSVSAPLGDLHNAGRCVYKLQFADGRAVIYKPRPVHAERTFGRVLELLRLRGCEPQLSYGRTLCGHRYGWADYISTQPCLNGEEASRFYRRQGGFLALFWLLCGDDAICDNVVVNGEHPVWVDTECICRPELWCAAGLTSAMPEWIKESILTTGMVFHGKQRGVPARQYTGLHACCALNRTNVFSSNDVLKGPYVDAVKEGFREMYTWMLAHYDVVRADDGLLAWWRDLTVRVLLRPTKLYADMVNLWVVTPRAKRHVVQKDLERALRSCGGPGSAAGAWPVEVVEAEMEAIRRGDIPYWSVSTSSQEVYEASGLSVRSLVGATGMQCITRRASRMCEQDLTRQLWLIESFLGRAADREQVS